MAEESGISRRGFLSVALATAAPAVVSSASGCAGTIAARGLETLVTKYQPKYKTIGHVFLDMERELGAKPEDYKVLDDIIDEAKSWIDQKTGHSEQEALATLTFIDRMLKRKGFTYKVNELLSKGLKSKKIDCDNYSVIYLSVAEALNLPIVAVDAPEHMFIRWKLKGGDEINWEATNGKQYPDITYELQKNISDTAKRKGTFMRNLSRDEVIGEQYMTRGSVWEEKDKIGKALRDFNEAIRRHPKLEAAYINRSCVLKDKGKLELALKDVDTAIGLEPNDSDGFYLKGMILHKQRKYSDAIAEFTTIIDRIKPRDKKDMAMAYNYRGLTWYELGEFDKAKKDLDKAVDLDKSRYKYQVSARLSMEMSDIDIL